MIAAAVPAAAWPVIGLLAIAAALLVGVLIGWLAHDDD